MTAGTHGSTFGGNPLAMAVGNAVLDVLLAPGFLEGVRKKALLLKQRLAEVHDRHSQIITEVRGDGLLLGLRTSVPNGDLVDALRAEHVLAVAAGDNVVRLLPPLVISESEIAEGMERLDRAASAIERSLKNKQKLSGAAG
jgi:acetylornithine/N-succinyldiaminopimelate aminotransferase